MNYKHRGGLSVQPRDWGSQYYKPEHGKPSINSNLLQDSHPGGLP